MQVLNGLLGYSGFKFADCIGLLTITRLGAPSYSCSITGPNTLFYSCRPLDNRLTGSVLQFRTSGSRVFLQLMWLLFCQGRYQLS